MVSLRAKIAIARLLRAAIVMPMLGMPAWASNDDGLRAFGQGDYGAALREFSNAAISGDASAVLNALFMLDNTCDGPLSPGNTDQLIRQAADAGNSVATFLGAMAAQLGDSPGPYLRGAELTRATKRAAEQGYWDAMIFRGHYFERTVPAQPISAYAWYALAAQRGSLEAAEDRDRVAGTLTAKQLEQGNTLIQRLSRTVPTLKLIDPSKCHK